MYTKTGANLRFSHQWKLQHSSLPFHCTSPTTVDKVTGRYFPWGTTESLTGRRRLSLGGFRSSRVADSTTPPGPTALWEIRTDPWAQKSIMGISRRWLFLGVATREHLILWGGQGTWQGKSKDPGTCCSFLVTLGQTLPPLFCKGHLRRNLKCGLNHSRERADPPTQGHKAGGQQNKNWLF